MTNTIVRRRLVGTMVYVGGTFIWLLVVTTSPATAADRSVAGDTALQATSWLTTIPYGAAKLAYALGGGIVGSLAWVFTGGNTPVAQAVWMPAMTGDYIVRPENFTGERPLHFVGESTQEY
jgi:hypothetical protein